MDTPTHPDSTLTPMHTLTDGSSLDEEVAVEQFHEKLREIIDHFLKDMKPIEQEIIATRILTEDPVSLKDIGKNYGITREAVRQAEQRLLKKLRLYLAEQMPEAKDYFTH